jgi:hypothetical protein
MSELDHRIQKTTHDGLKQLLIKVKQEADKPLSREFINFKLTNIRAELDELEEAVHYAKQDLAHYEENMEISEKATEARRALQETEKQIEHLKKEYSTLNALL